MKILVLRNAAAARWLLFFFSCSFLSACANPPKPENYHVNYIFKKTEQYGQKKISVKPGEIQSFQVFFNEDLPTIEPGSQNIRVLEKIFILLKDKKLYYTYDVDKKSYLYKHNKLDDASMTYHSENGSFAPNGLFQASSGNLEAARKGYPILVGPRETNFVMKKTFKPSFYVNKNLIKKSDDGKHGSYGKNGQNGNFFHKDGKDAQNGAPGTPGKNGLDIDVDVMEFKSPFYDKTLVRLEIKTPSLNYDLIIHRDQQFEILSLGGKGGDGGNGGNGGYGVSGNPGKNASCEGCDGAPGEKGGDGGKGGAGGQGGQGGDGGQLRVNFICSDSFFALIKNNLTFSSQGGAGGQGGKGGTGGLGGPGGKGGQGGPANKNKDISTGANGINGADGIAGPDGQDGTRGNNGLSKRAIINRIKSNAIFN